MVLIFWNMEFNASVYYDDELNLEQYCDGGKLGFEIATFVVFESEYVITISRTSISRKLDMC